MDIAKIAQISPAVRMLLMEGKTGIVSFKECNCTPDVTVKDGDVEGIYTQLETEVAAYKAANGKAPKIVRVEGLGNFRFGACKAEADGEEGSVHSGRLAEKISIVTGSAQGFGKGVAEAMLEEGAYVVIADLNYELARQVADEFNAKYGSRCHAAKVDVGNEDSVKEMIDSTVAYFGGLDIFVSNAGVLKAGSLEEMDMKSFEFVTKINYVAYFLCVKYASAAMKLQNRFKKDYMMDIIQINSKSGLEGSNKNFAYAGSKFGGVGLTQSFALELVPYGIKVNAVCPGNFLDGPLWTNPEKGLFVQYLHAGKVPGAKTIEDVKRFYEAKVPMNRGCFPIDVARALFYVVEQKYETGQAIPVTGGQNMLN